MARSVPPQEMSSPPTPVHPWYALKVRTKAEELVQTALQRKGYELYLPTHLDLRQYSDRVKKVRTALFPGYVFCRLDITARLPVLLTPYVEYFVSFNDEPVPVDESELDGVRAMLGSGLETKPWPYLISGDRVRVVVGSMAGVEGILVREKGSDLLIISVHLLQRSLSVQIDRTWIRPVSSDGTHIRREA